MVDFARDSVEELIRGGLAGSRALCGRDRGGLEAAAIGGALSFYFPFAGGSAITGSGTWLLTGGIVFRYAKIALRSSSL